MVSSQSRPMLALLLGLVLGCSAAPSTTRNVLLISIDTLRADVLGCYGEPRPTSPFLDSLAARGVLFEQASATSPWTLPSHASLLTGLYPHHHGARSERNRLAEDVETLAERLEDAGFQTGAVVNSAYVSPRFGFEQGFQRFEYLKEQLASRAPAPVAEAALRVLREIGDQRFFVFVHSYDVHSDYASLPDYEARFALPYDGSIDGSTAQLLEFRQGRRALAPADVRHLTDLYRASVRQLDDVLRTLFDGLERGGWLRETLVVVTSDHGEEFLEHGGVLHGRTQFQEVLRVPLILAGPGVPAGTRVAEPVSIVDVVPTVLAYLGLPAPRDQDGVDLAAHWAAERPDGLERRVLFGEADHNRRVPDSTRSVRQGRFKLVHDLATVETWLFDLEVDPGEQVDVARHHPDLTATLLARARRIGRAPSAPPLQLEAEEEERLRALGYLD